MGMEMQHVLYLVRHGIAENVGDRPEVRTDADRALTNEGVRKMEMAAVGLKRLGVAPGRVISSGLARAVQTAEILIDVLGVSLDIEESAALMPWADPSDGLPLFRSAEHDDVMVVGHLPHLPLLAAFLLTGNAEGVALTLKKGAVCCLSFSSALARPREARLEWLAQPKLLRTLAAKGT